MKINKSGETTEFKKEKKNYNMKNRLRNGGRQCLLEWKMV